MFVSHFDGERLCPHLWNLCPVHLCGSVYVCICMCVCVCVCVHPEKTQTHNLILSPLSESLPLSGLEVSWLFSCIVATSTQRWSVLVSSTGDDQWTGSAGEVMRAVLLLCVNL